MKYYSSFIVILVFIAWSQNVWALPAESTFYGFSHLKDLPPVLKPGETKSFDIIIQNVHSSTLYNVSPIIEVTPQESQQSLRIKADSIPALESKKIRTIPVMISTDSHLPIRDIHVYAYFVAKDKDGISRTGAWSDHINNVITVEPLSPLQQFRSGIKIENIQCKEGLELIIRSDDRPACVKLESMPELFKRGIGFLTRNYMPYSPYPDHN